MFLNNLYFQLAAVPLQDMPDVFFMDFPPGAPGQSCGDLFGGGPNSYVVFEREGGPGTNVTGFSIPYLYGAVQWTRV